MKTFVVYEVWTKSYLARADSIEDVLEFGDPDPIQGLDLSNWHAVEVPYDQAEIPSKQDPHS